MLLLLAALLTQDPRYDTVDLEIGRRAEAVLPVDLNGDGFPDLVVQSGKEIRVFHFRPDVGFSSRATQRLRLPNDVYLWTLAHVGGPKAWSLVTASSRGLHWHPPADGGLAARAKDLVIYPNIFEGESADEKGPAHVPFAPDLNGDGLSDLFLFRAEEMFVMIQQRDASFRLLQKLPLPIEARMKIAWNPIMRHKEERTIPVLHVGDATGDRRPDILLYHMDTLTVFEQRKDGRFAAGAKYDLALDKQKRNRRFVKLELPPRIVDFDGDGILDVALSYPYKGRVHVYYLRAGRKDLTRPDDVLQVGNSWNAGLWNQDLDQDGKPDLILGIIRKLGISAGIRTFLSGRIDLELHVHHMGAKGRFTLDPDQVLTFSIPYSFTLSRTEATIDLSFRPTFGADINGDGLGDLLVSTEAGVIHVHYGVRGKGFQGEAGGRIPIRLRTGTATTRVAAADFNRDGKSDLILRHINVNEQRDYVQIKLSR